MDPNKIIIVAAIASEKQIVLYKENGDTMVLKTNHYKTEAIMDKVLPQLAKKNRAELILDDYILHKNFTKKTNGLVRFFRVAKAAVAGLFTSDENKSMSVQKIETTGSEDTEMEHSDSDKDTIVAIVENSETGVKTAIPGMEKLEPQIKWATENNAVGFKIFLDRISNVIKKRGHSMEDLLTFMERGDLPIADDGSVIAYKALRKNKSDKYYLDIHSGKVKQTIGSFVHMDIDQVDSSRSKDCSYGLHIARRSYLSGFRGDVCVICKIAPEDFIAVPQYNANKVRVRAYHIIHELNKEAYALLMSNKAMTSDPESAKLLGDVISGNHTGITNTVKIDRKGTILVSEVLQEKVNTVFKESKPTEAIIPTEAVKRVVEKPMTPQEVREKASKAKDEDLSPQQIKAKKLLSENFSKAQVASDLGISTRTLGRWIDKNNWVVTSEPIKPKTQDNVQIKKTNVKKPAKKKDFVDGIADALSSKNAKDMQAKNSMTHSQKVLAAYNTYVGTPSEDNLLKVFALKKAAKKSFDSLGLTETQEAFLHSEKTKYVK